MASNVTHCECDRRGSLLAPAKHLIGMDLLQDKRKVFELIEKNITEEN
jgi:hypothetical protein